MKKLLKSFFHNFPVTLFVDLVYNVCRSENRKNKKRTTALSRLSFFFLVKPNGFSL